MINVVTVSDKLTIPECVQIWHIANKFQNRSVKLHIGLRHNPDQHHLTSLIYKLDWEKQNNNPNFDFEIYFPEQIFSVCEDKVDLKWALIEEYLKENRRLDYIVYIHIDTIFSQQPTPAMWNNIENKTDWYGGNSLIYGKNLQKENNWIFLEDYPLINDVTDIQHYKNNKWPSIALFAENLKKSSDYTYISWHEMIRNNYLTGVNSFEWEKKIENMSESKVFETLAYKLLNTISERGDKGTGGITSAFD